MPKTREQEQVPGLCNFCLKSFAEFSLADTEIGTEELCEECFKKALFRHVTSTDMCVTFQRVGDGVTTIAGERVSPRQRFKGVFSVSIAKPRKQPSH
jgi:hypothetical protein